MGVVAVLAGQPTTTSFLTALVVVRQRGGGVSAGPAPHRLPVTTTPHHIL